MVLGYIYFSTSVNVEDRPFSILMFPSIYLRIVLKSLFAKLQPKIFLNCTAYSKFQSNFHEECEQSENVPFHSYQLKNNL